VITDNSVIVSDTRSLFFHERFDFFIMSVLFLRAVEHTKVPTFPLP